MSEQRELYSGLIRLHVLHHACHEPIFGLWMIEELARHGYRLSAGTLYPLLNGMEKRGLLRSSRELVDGKFRRMYRATPAGRAALRIAKKASEGALRGTFRGRIVRALRDRSAALSAATTNRAL